MKIRNQTWIEEEKCLTMIALNEPYWSAYTIFKGFNVESHEWGIGISIEAINEAQRLGKRIRVKIIKWGTYEITTNKCKDYIENGKKTADKKVVLVIPHSAFVHIPNEGAVEKQEKKEEIRIKINQDRQMELL